MEIRQALGRCKDICLFSAGLDISNHAPFVFSHHDHIPSVHDFGWLEALNQVIAEHAIDYIFPAYDDVLVALVENVESIPARIVTSPLETCRITRSKSLTYRHYAGSVRTPKRYAGAEEVDRFPVFVKPDRGQGSHGAHIVRDKKHLITVLEQDEKPLILEYLPGDEYTIDCFTDREAGLLFCGGRQRVRTRAGISVASRPIQDPQFRAIAERLSQGLRFHGGWFFQLKKDADGACVLLEIGPRIAGTMALHRVYGVNFPLLSIYEQERIPITITPNKAEIEIDRALVNRFRHSHRYTVVYTDLDDTLIINGHVNTSLLGFLYQCVNASIPIKLITKHVGDLNGTLSKHRLICLFDDIIHLKRHQCKADFISEQNAILIDDSFSERMAVHQALGIPTFDCSMVEALIDERL